MAIINKAIDLFPPITRCAGCGKKLPKKLAYWCNTKCLSKYLDKVIKLEGQING